MKSWKLSQKTNNYDVIEIDSEFVLNFDFRFWNNLNITELVKWELSQSNFLKFLKCIPFLFAILTELLNLNS